MIHRTLSRQRLVDHFGTMKLLTLERKRNMSRAEGYCLHTLMRPSHFSTHTQPRSAPVNSFSWDW